MTGYCLLVAATLVATAVGQTLTTTPAVSLTVTLTAEARVVKVGSHIVLNVVLTNSSDKPIQLAVARNDGLNGEANYRVLLTDQNGNPVPETAYYRNFKCALRQGPCTESDPQFGLSGNMMGIPLAVGGELRTQIDLNKLFTITVPGVYTVQVQWDNSYQPGGVPTSASMRSNRLTIKVQP